MKSVAASLKKKILLDKLVTKFIKKKIFKKIKDWDE